MKGLENKVIIVTGGATHIGAGVVATLRSYGARAAVFDIDVAGGQAAVGSQAEHARSWSRARPQLLTGFLQLHLWCGRIFCLPLINLIRPMRYHGL